ncbi:hypothetical protein SS50377_25139 [Spironucleus salmonicida]|uniref:Uncharacterized protein n=1 Tax=Spironucleus salmonicida TaxID=348837 RepID=A0A9P8RXZ7_9EUKA|nr:hypothetical protein SS50377_25139 [Spironucleus salmonicida]
MQNVEAYLQDLSAAFFKSELSFESLQTAQATDLEMRLIQCIQAHNGKPIIATSADIVARAEDALHLQLNESYH